MCADNGPGLCLHMAVNYDNIMDKSQIIINAYTAVN